MTAPSEVSLLCLAPDTVVPSSNGSAARTMGLAAAVRPHLASVAIHSFSVVPQPARGPGGLDIVHRQLPTGGIARTRFLAAALLGPTLGFRYRERIGGERTLVQLESPLIFEAARRAGLRHFVLDAHNVYQDMTEFRQASLRDRVFYRVTRRRRARMEVACWKEAAHVIFCSPVDQDRAERLLPGVARRASVVPNCVDAGAFVPRPPSAFRRGGPVLFVGTTRYPPNYFAIQEICRDVAPALPDLQFWIVGDPVWAPASAPPNVRFLGRVESTAPHLAAAQVAIAPLRDGSGTRLKLLEYFAAGLPVVCTAKAAEGLNVEPGRHLRLVDSPREVVAAVRTLHADPGACAALGSAARVLVEQRYDWRAYVPRLLEIYANHAPA